MKIGFPVKRKHARIEIIPLIDIMFFLLASFMMVSLQLDRSQNIHVALPQASMSHHDFKPDMLNIAVDKSGHAWFEKKAVSLPQLAIAVSNRFRADTNLPVYIIGDRETLNSAMTEVYQTVRSAGVQDVSFMVSESGARGATHPTTQ
jgi:biopolymer transport protein ExbD